ncbi:MAG: hypothetical protein FWF72_00470 [Paludibacter sp.]|nr:hypothetical protein [Paludibacter sp.]
MINASVVLYNHKPSEIALLINSLRKSDIVSNIFLIDNSDMQNAAKSDCFTH